MSLGVSLPSQTTLAALAEQFEVFLLDQFGVLHDGLRPYEGAVAALEFLQAQGKQVALISNSGKRAEVNLQRMETLGFARDLFQQVVTSGEVAHSLFQQELSSLGLRPGARYYAIARDPDRSALAGTSLQEVSSVNEAEVILLLGSEADRETLDTTLDELRPAWERALPCVCLNPDKWMLTASGLVPGSGAIADRYAEQGGSVFWIGKPYPQIYEFAQRLLKFERSDAVAIGDSIEHDVAGAVRFGCSGVLVRSGILHAASPEELKALMEEHQAQPRFVLERFAP